MSALAVEAAKAAAAAQGDRREIARSLQLELRRVGCFDGAIDGEFSDATRTALRNFVKLAALRIPDDLSLDAVKAARSTSGWCPLVRQAGERADGERCVRITCPSGQVLKDGACVTERAPSPAARPGTPAPKGGTGAKCFTFQGRQFCE